MTLAGLRLLLVPQTGQFARASGLMCCPVFFAEQVAMSGEYPYGFESFVLDGSA
jgi:hypothetical protein